MGRARSSIPAAYDWRDADWRGRRWEEIVIYELHLGTFSERGDFAGVDAPSRSSRRARRHRDRTDAGRGFSGRRNWGYDGVLTVRAGSPLRPARRSEARWSMRATRAASRSFLDVVYNHFGPEGNYLHVYRAAISSPSAITRRGARRSISTAPNAGRCAISSSRTRFTGSRNFISTGCASTPSMPSVDDSQRHILAEIAETVRARVSTERPVHLVLENDGNEAHGCSSGRGLYTAQWNDDLHHALHVLATGESAGYYADYADAPVEQLGRALAEGFAYQGEPLGLSRRRDARRAVGASAADRVRLVSAEPRPDRQYAVRHAAIALASARGAACMRPSRSYLLSPQIPLLFMGEEWASRAALPLLLRFRRRRSTTRCARGGGANSRTSPNSATRRRARASPIRLTPRPSRSAVLDWTAARREPPHATGSSGIAGLLALRAREIVPRLAGMRRQCRRMATARAARGAGRLAARRRLAPDCCSPISATPR